MNDPFDRILADAEKRRSAKDLETVREAILELFHCADAGPEWFTKGRAGQMNHAREWHRRADASLAVIQQTLEQAQDCIRGETPEDCSVEEARDDTIRKIREALGL